MAGYESEDVFASMIARLRRITRVASLTALLVTSLAVTTVWALGPFYRFGAVLAIPFADQTIDFHAGAGMIHVTYNPGRPPTRWCYVYQAAPYPPVVRAQHLDTYLSLQLPKSIDNTSIGTASWSASLWIGDAPAPKSYRCWFPAFVPVAVCNAILLALFVRWRFKRAGRA